VKGRTPTKKEQLRFEKLRELGCIVCLNTMNVCTPPAIHHIDGKTKEGSHDLTIPLCQSHHQYKSNSTIWISRHGDGRAAFENAYGTEQELLEQVNGMI
jgi:hypothetical protein